MLKPIRLVSMARKNTSDDAVAASTAPKQKKPKKTRWYHQVWDVYKLTVENDPKSRWYIWGSALGVLALFLILALIFRAGTGMMIYMGIIGLMFAPLAAMFVLARRAETVQYSLIEGQPGAARAALGTLRRGWSFPEEPAAFDAKTQALLFRGVGRAGVVIVTEGPAKAAGRLAEKETKRLSRMLPNVPLHVFHTGNEEGQTPLPKLTREVQRLKPKLTKAELAEVDKRLTAIGRMQLPIPKGIDPTRARPDRRGMR